MDLTVEFAHLTMFFNQGKCCRDASRVFMEGQVYAKFITCRMEYAKNRPIGDPFNVRMKQETQVTC